MKVNKVICDVCGKELVNKTDIIRLEAKKIEIVGNYSNGYKKFQEFEVCEDCYNNEVLPLMRQTNIKEVK